MQSFSRIDALFRRAMLVTAATTVMAFGATPAVAQDAFAVGLVPADATSLAPVLADAAGAFTKYRIKPQLVTIEGGSRGLQVLLSGKIQVMQAGFSIGVNANREGADVRMITSSSNVMQMDIYANPSIKSPADFKGGKLAISAITSESDMAVSLALRKWNLTRKDVTVVPLGGASQRLAAQLSGQVLAAPYVTPATAMAAQKGLVKMLDLGNDGAPWVFNGMFVTRDFARAQPDLIKRFLKANVEGIYKAIADEKWAKQVIAKEFKTDSKVVIDDAYALLKQYFPRDFSPTPAALSNVINEVNSMGPALPSKNPSDYVDLQFVEALKKEGFFDQMKKQYGI